MKKKNHKFISIVVATIAAGIPITTVSAHQLDLTDPSFLLIWCIMGVIGSFGTYLYFSLQKSDIIGTFIVGYVLAVILRFVTDIVVNSISHSNLSLSLFIAMGAGAFAGWAGSSLWTLLKKSRKKK